MWLLQDDYIVDNSKLKSTGYELLSPDFRTSMKEIGRAGATRGFDPGWVAERREEQR